MASCENELSISDQTAKYKFKPQPRRNDKVESFLLRPCLDNLSIFFV